MLSIEGPEFDAVIKLRDAYRAMERFLEIRASRGGSADPAALRDYLDAVAQIAPPAPASFGVILTDDPGDSDEGAVEVTVVLPDGSTRWCFFMTPAAMANVGDWVAGTRIPMHWGELHMFVVAVCTEEVIRAVLAEVAQKGELFLRTRPF